MEPCRFRPGDRVDVDVKSLKGTPFYPETVLLKIIFGQAELEKWVVFHREYDKRLQEWMIWIESPAGEIQKIEQRRLRDRPENFGPTRAAIRQGKTAKEITGS